MKQRVLRRFLVAVLLTGVALSATGCALWNRIQTTQITVQVSGDRLLHLAIIPRVLPDGQRPTEQLDALLEEVARRAGGYTYIEKVMGGWIPPGETEIVEELNDLLLVQGPPELAYFLEVKLHEDFQQEYPFVVSLPIQSIAVLEAALSSEAEEAEEGRP